MQQKERIHYLDWLRVAAFAILIVFHSWQPFTNFSWLLKSGHTSIVADIFTVFFHTWRLHLIFFVSGVGTWFALRSRGKRFFQDRLMRLIVPFVFGAIAIVPCQYFFQSLQRGTEIGFIDFMINYPKFILSKDLAYDLFLWILEIGIHLWYLPYLFIMTLITLPILKLIDLLGLSDASTLKLTQRPKLVLLFALPIIITTIILKPVFPEYTSVADFCTYACSFVYGFVFIKQHGRLLPVIQKNNTELLISGIISSLLLIACLLDETMRNAAFNPEYGINHCIISALIGLSAFSWPLYFVSLFSRRFNFNNRALPALNRSVLPIYIIHQNIIVAAGFYIIRYIDNGIFEFLLIILATIIGSFVMYHLIQMFKLTRLLFGLKR